MENNNSYEKFLACVKQQTNAEQTTMECSVGFDAEDEVVKVLSIDVCAEISNVECLNGEANVNGNMVIGLIYSTINNTIKKVNYVSTFSAKVQDDFIAPDCKVLAKAEIKEATISNLTSSNAKVLITYTICLDCAKNQEIDYLCGASDDICIKNSETTAMFASSCANHDFVEHNSFELKEPIQTLLSSVSQIICDGYETSYNTLTINGKIVNKIIYLSDEEVPMLKTIQNVFDFKQDIEIEGLGKESVVDFELQLQNKDAKTTIDEKAEQTTIELELPIRACVIVYENKTLLTVSDLFSTKNNVLVTSMGYNNCVVKKPQFFEKQIDGSLNLTENEPRIDKLLAVTYSRATILSSYIKDEQIYVEGLAEANLIYLNDEESKLCSVDIEIPFVAQNATDFSDTAQLSVRASLCDVDVVVKKGRDVYFDAKLCVFVVATECGGQMVISGVEVAEALPPKDAGIEIYFAKSGEEVWDIAKQLKCEPSLVEMQNSKLTFPLEKDENIAVFYGKN